MDPSAAWALAWGDSWGTSWGPLHEVDAPPISTAMGHNAPPIAQTRKRRGINRRRTKIEDDRRVARRQDDEDILLVR